MLKPREKAGWQPLSLFSREFRIAVVFGFVNLFDGDYTGAGSRIHRTPVTPLLRWLLMCQQQASIVAGLLRCGAFFR
jgi:hypothetical protein